MCEYIERQKILDKAHLAYKIAIGADELDEDELRKYDGVEFTDAFAVDQDDIIEMPAADVALVVHGEWVMYENKVYHCSMCGQLRPFDDDYDYWESNYCPNCGAKMDGNK